MKSDKVKKTSVATMKKKYHSWNIVWSLMIIFIIGVSICYSNITYLKQIVPSWLFALIVFVYMLFWAGLSGYLKDMRSKLKE